jgi:cytochrome P450
VSWTHRLHEKYGDVVRSGPDRLSYINSQAWKDIAGHRTGGRSENSKDPRTYSREINGEFMIVSTPDNHYHGKLRKVFSHGFSDKALKLQEPLIQGYVTKLIGIISKATTADPDVKLDMVKLYNFTTFDIMGDLTFGEPLGMLETSEYTPWVAAVFGAIKLAAFGRLMLEYAWVGRVFRALQPKDNFQKFHFDHSAQRVDRRMEKGTDAGKPDIWKLVLEKSGKDQLAISEMHANATTFMTAGTETTATLLSGLTFLLLKNPDKLQQVVKEVRSLSCEDLSLEVLPRLPYLNACFEEGLRCYPPVPIGLPRAVGKGGNAINGQWVPEKVCFTLVLKFLVLTKDMMM